MAGRCLPPAYYRHDHTMLPVRVGLRGCDCWRSSLCDVGPGWWSAISGYGSDLRTPTPGPSMLSRAGFVDNGDRSRLLTVPSTLLLPCGL